MPEGIEVRHEKSCRSNEGRACNCDPGYRAVAAYRGQRASKTFRTQREAVAWRRREIGALHDGSRNGDRMPTLAAVMDDVINGMQAGVVRNRSGRTYKPSAVRDYKAAWKNHLAPLLAQSRVDEISRIVVQGIVDKWMRDGVAPQTIRNRLMPLRVAYRRLVQRGYVAVSPTHLLDLPASEGRRDRIATPDEAARLIDAIKPLNDRVVWALAAYAGLRIGEIRGLKHDDILDREILVQRSFDRYEGEVATKSKAGARRVPILARLRPILDAHIESSKRDRFLLGSWPTEETGLRRRAQTAWKNAGLEPITPHELRHTFASLAIAAGVNAKTLSTLMGHSSITVTLDRYGHLLPGSYEDFVAKMDGYLA